ncbi:MAG: hypothetical protein ABIZ34_08675 [Candidatus Limnocylindrales bacterium]
MFDPNLMRVLHPHGDEMVPMRLESPSSSHDPAASDPEREWARHGRVYVCDCGEKVTVMPQHREEIPPRQ